MNESREPNPGRHRESGVRLGREPALDRLARVAAQVTGGARALIVLDPAGEVVADSARLEGIAGTEDMAGAPALGEPARAIHARVLGGETPLLAGSVLAAAVRAANGEIVGSVVAHAPDGHDFPEALAHALDDTAALVAGALAPSAQPGDALARVILESIPDACVLLDREWRYTFVNRRAGEVFGRDPAQLIGKHIWTEFPEGKGQPFHLAYEQAVRERRSTHIEAFYEPWNRWFENAIHPSAHGLAIFFRDVTEQRAVAQERRRLASIVDATTDLIALAGEDGALLYLNRGGRRLLGIDERGSVATRTLASLYATPSRDDTARTSMPQARRESSWSGEATLATVDGREIPTLAVLLWQPAMPLDPGFFSLVARDITDRKRDEEEARNQARVRSQAERMAHLGFWRWDVRSNRVTWSDELHRIYGLDPAQFGASFEAYLARVHPGDRARVRGAIEGVLAAGEAVAFEERIVRPDGQTRHLHSWGTLTRDEDGTPVEMLGTCLDMTELIETAEGLRRSEEWLDLALGASGIGLWDRNLRTDEVTWSEGAERLFGLPPGALGGTFSAFLERIHPDDRRRVEDTLRRALEADTPLEVEHRVTWPDGSPHVLVERGRVFRDPAGKPARMAGAIVDVTEQRRAQDEQRQLGERLRQAQKMEAIGRLAAGVAHDFNNLLTIVAGETDLLRRDRTLAPSAREGVDQIADAARRAASLTKQLLAFSRQQSLAPRVLAVDAVIGELVELLRRALPTGVELRTELGARDGRILVDRGQLEQVLLNLVVNARDAIRGPGTVTIATRDEPKAVVFEVRDTGVGMSPELQGRIFEPFFTTKELGHGTGLGLSTVYGIVNQSGGRIDVGSAPGVGTTFTVRLPRAELGAELAETPPPRSSPRGAVETILVVEDDAMVRRVVRRILEEHRYRVVDVAAADEALVICHDAAHAVDLLVSDLHLPRMSGGELARRVRQIRPDLRILFMSGWADERSLAGLRVPVLEKPFDDASLARRVREVLDGSAPH